MGSEVKNNWVLFLTSETEQSKEKYRVECIETKVIDYATLEGKAKSSETEQSKEQSKLSVPKRRFATMRLWRARR